MKKISIPINFNELLMLGDIHGEWDIIEYQISKYSITDAAIIQVGDFNIGYNKKQDLFRLKILNEQLTEINCFLYVIRGNHDNPDCFHNWQPFSNILFVEDYTILSLNVNENIENILCIGGAISIDRNITMKESAWWKDEVIVWNEKLFPKAEDEITIIVTHTAPDTVPPFNLSEICYHFAKNDSTLINDLIDERRLMTSLANTLIDICSITLKKWYYGHFHFSATYNYKYVDFKLLSINELCSVS